MRKSDGSIVLISLDLAFQLNCSQNHSLLEPEINIKEIRNSMPFFSLNAHKKKALGKKDDL